MRTSKQFEFRVVVMCDLEGYSRGVWRAFLCGVVGFLLCAGDFLVAFLAQVNSRRLTGIWSNEAYS